MEQEHSGYFKVGDYIETSGKPEGIVVEANADTFMLRPFRDRGKEGKLPKLGNFCVIYSNDVEQYKNKYWIKVMPKETPFEYTQEDIRAFDLT